MADQKTYNEFMLEVKDRFRQLSDNDKDAIRSLRGTPEGRVLSKVLGEIGLINLGIAKKPTARSKKRGLATR